jgi:hypothetical protein
MRSKLNTTLVVAALGLFTIATACGDDTGSDSPGGGEAGESGSGSGGDGATSSGGSATSGSGGSASGNGGSTSGNGGSTSGSGGDAVSGGNGGDPSVNGGNGGDPAVNGGESGSAGESGGGGEPSGSGGAAAGAGGGGPVTCTPITLDSFELGDLDPAYVNYTASFTPNIQAATADSFVLSIQGPPDYDGNLTGTFDLTENGDENYKTCARCLLVFGDLGPNRTVYYASEGTLVIDPASTQLTGNIDATITDVTLVEVTIANDYTSTPVPNGRCLTVASAEIAVMTGAPAGWTCDPDYYDDDGCDCGCGVKDVDCTGTTDESECDYCTECTGNVDPCGTGNVDPADTTVCL